MTDLTRLKFAYVRGARIQRDYAAIGYMGIGFVRSAKDDGWRDSDPYLSHLGMGDSTHWRIHPDDAHLEYGPLSNELRESVMYTTHEYSPYYVAAAAWVREYIEIFVGPRMSYAEETLGMLILFIAEFLADKGL